jgi:hypothetical protein
MSKEKGVFRAVVVPAMLAMAGAGALAFFLSQRQSDAPPIATRTLPAPAPTPAAEPQPEPSVGIPAPAPAQAPAEPRSDAEVEAQAAAAAQADAVSEAGAMSPELRRHALLMIPATLQQAVESENVVHVRALRDQLAARRADNLLSASDFEALDLIVECMEHVADSRDEARDFLEFGAATMLRDPLKQACQ